MKHSAYIYPSIMYCVVYEWHYFTLGADNFIHVPHPAGNPESFLSPCWQSYLRELGEALQGRVRQCSCVHCVRNNFIGWLSKEGSAYLVICKCSSSIEQTSNRIWIHLACMKQPCFSNLNFRCAGIPSNFVICSIPGVVNLSRATWALLKISSLLPRKCP